MKTTRNGMIYTITCCNPFSYKSHPPIAKQSFPIGSSLDYEAIVKGSANFPLSSTAKTRKICTCRPQSATFTLGKENSLYTVQLHSG